MRTYVCAYLCTNSVCRVIFRIDSGAPGSVHAKCPLCGQPAVLRDQKVDLILHSKDLWNRLNDLVEQALAEPMADPSLVMNVPTRVADYGKQLEVLNWLLMSFGAGSSMPQSLPEEVERLVLDPPNTASGSSEKGSSSHGKSRTRGKKSSKSGRQKRR